MKGLLTLLLVFALISCKTDPPEPLTELEKLPPLTFEGKETFGCLIDGKAFVARSPFYVNAVYQGFFDIGASFNKPEISLGVLVDEEIKVGTYLFYEYNETDAFNYGSLTFIENIGCEYYTWDDSGFIEIKFFDSENHIISGTFEFEAYTEDCQDTVRVTEGRFDLKYIPSSQG